MSLYSGNMRYQECEGNHVVSSTTVVDHKSGNKSFLLSVLGNLCFHCAWKQLPKSPKTESKSRMSSIAHDDLR
jgi:hypothetical protein